MKAIRIRVLWRKNPEALPSRRLTKYEWRHHCEQWRHNDAVQNECPSTVTWTKSGFVILKRVHRAGMNRILHEIHAMNCSKCATIVSLLVSGRFVDDYLSNLCRRNSIFLSYPPKQTAFMHVLRFNLAKRNTRSISRELLDTLFIMRLMSLYLISFFVEQTFPDDIRQ